MTVSGAPNCGITFTIKIDDNSKGQDTIVQASFMMIVAYL